MNGAGLSYLREADRAAGARAVAPWVAGYVGIPFTEKGYDRDGLNCWGLACLVYAERLGIALPRHEELYTAQQVAGGIGDLRSLAAIIADHAAALWEELALWEARPTDLLLLPIAAQPCHVAIYAGDRHILHVEEGCDSVCEDLRLGAWSSRLGRARLFRYRAARVEGHSNAA